MKSEPFTIARYRDSRFWGLYERGQLLCVTVYKKGAEAVKTRIERGAAIEPPRRETQAPPRQHARTRRRHRA